MGGDAIHVGGAGVQEIIERALLYGQAARHERLNYGEIGVDREAMMQGFVVQSDRNRPPPPIADLMALAGGIDDCQIAFRNDLLRELGKPHGALLPAATLSSNPH